MSSPPSSPEVRFGLRANRAQLTVLSVLIGLTGGMVGMERAVLPLLAEREFSLTSKAAILSFIISYGILKAPANLGGGWLSDRFGRKRILIIGWLFGFGLHAMGDQMVKMVISQMTAATPDMTNMPGMPPGHMPPSMRSGSPNPGSTSTGGMPFYGHGPQTTVPGSDVSDWGASGWASWSLSPVVSLNLNVARSVSYDLTTVRVGLGFNLSRPISRLLRR